MPSLEDVANEIKSILEDVKTNTSNIKGDTNSIKGSGTAIKNNTDTIINQLSQIDVDMKNGFTNLAQGLQVMIALGLQTNHLLAENNDQNRTIICWLVNIANTLCEVKRNTDREVKLHKDISMTLHHIDDIGELANATEAMQVASRYELEAKMNECCPPEEEPEKPCFEKCPEPRPSRFEPVKTDWKPVDFGDKRPPIG